MSRLPAEAVASFGRSSQWWRALGEVRQMRGEGLQVTLGSVQNAEQGWDHGENLGETQGSRMDCWFLRFDVHVMNALL